MDKHLIFKVSGVIWIIVFWISFIFSLIGILFSSPFILGSLFNYQYRAVFFEIVIEIIFLLIFYIMIYPIGYIILEYADNFLFEGKKLSDRSLPRNKTDWWTCTKCGQENTPTAKECANCFSKKN